MKRIRRRRVIAVAALLIAAFGAVLAAWSSGVLRFGVVGDFAVAPEGWIALATIALAAATVWLAWQTRALTVNAREELALLRQQTDATTEQVRLLSSDIEAGTNLNAYKLLRAEDQRFVGKRFVKNRARLARALLLAPNDFRTVSDYADYVLEYFEDLGILLRREIVPDYFVWATSAYYVLRYWQATKDYVALVRKRDSDPTLYEDFEYLNGRMRMYEENRLGRELVLSVAEVNRFLVEELEETDPVALRGCRPPDLPRILEIEASAFSDAFAYARPQFEGLLRDHPDGFLVAEMLREKIVGYVVGYVSHGILDVDSIAVDPGFRRIGFGQKLLLALIDKLTGPGVVAVSLETSVSNAAGQQDFFTSMGFDIVETVVDFYGAGRDAYRMRKALPHTRPSAG
jgi:ribosomal-protein-alanine N-acetyltransferase